MKEDNIRKKIMLLQQVNISYSKIYVEEEAYPVYRKTHILYRKD